MEMVENISNVLMIFGGIFLIIGVVAYFLMQKDVVNPDCPQDAENVKRNKRWSKWLLLGSFFAFLIGYVMKFIC